MFVNLSRSLYKSRKQATMKNILVLFAFISILGTSCKKDLIEKFEADKAKQASKNQAQNINELTVDQAFDWKTNKNVVVKLKGTVNAPVILMTEKGGILLKSMLKSNEELSVTVTLASAEKTIKAVYAGKISIIEVSTNQVSKEL